MASSISEP